MISIQQEQQWRREYLQKMRDILNDARGKYNLERLKELYPEDVEELDDLEGDDNSVLPFLLEVIAPILSLMPFIEKNVPAPQTKEDEEGKGFFPRYTLSEIFDYLSSITDYGKYRLLNQFPGDDDAYQELEKALFSNDKEKFIQIVKDRKLDFSEFRRRIEGNIYFATGTEELIARLIVPFSGQITGEDEFNRWEDDLEELGEIMSQHFPQTVYRSVKEIKGIGEDLLELPKDEIDIILPQRISGLHLSNEDVVQVFSVSVYFFYLFAIIFCSVLKDDELKVINDFLDASENRRVLNGIKRVLYVALEGNLTIDENCNLNRMFLGQGFKEELKTQNIDALVREFHPKPQITLAPDEQEQPEPQPTLAPTEGKKQEEDVTQEGRDLNEKPKKRRKPSIWLSEKYSMYSDTSVGLLLKAKIWDKLKEALTLLPLPNYGLKRMDGDIKSFGAALLFYVFKQLGIASEDATYGRSFERTMVAMGTESNVLQKNKFSAGPFARNSTTPHLEAISIVLPALCQLKEGKHLDIAKIQAKGSNLVKVLVNGHTTLMDAYQYLINKLPSIFEESSDNPANNAEAGSD